MRAYRLKLREQRSATDESGKLPPAAKRANHKAYMPADQQAGEESVSSEEMEASKRAKRAAYMREYRAKKKPADDLSSSSSDEMQSPAELAASRRAKRVAYQRDYRAKHQEAFKAYERRRYARFKPIRQQWDIDHPCGHCGKVWLKSS